MPKEEKTGAPPAKGDGKKPDDKTSKKGKEEKEGAGKPERKDAKKSLRFTPKPDFRYIVRLAETDLDGARTVEYALGDVRGIGIRTATAIADAAGVPRTERIGNLTDEQVEALSQQMAKLSSFAPAWILNRRADYFTGENLNIYGPDLDGTIREDINMMKKIRCYKGVRHENGQKVRGQRTKSNGRTGLTVGVTKKEALAAAAAAAATDKDKKGGAAPAAAPAADKDKKGGAAPAAAPKAEAKAEAKPADKVKK